MNPEPFIIWTLQRTGGTNLGQKLVLRSGLPSTQHEPFNINRVYGDVTKSWVETKDIHALRSSISEIVEEKIVMKHCVEMVPWEVSEQLIHASCEAGYKHLFLYRKNALGRLLSLHFAKLSGIWGPELYDKAELQDQIFSEELPVSELVKHERQCSRLLNKTWNLIKKKSGNPMALSFEALYEWDDVEDSITGILQLLEYMNLEKDKESDREFAKAVIGKGNQGTRDKYEKFKGIDDLQSELKNIERFEPNNCQLGIYASSMTEGVSWIAHAAVDTIPASLPEGQYYDVAGVVVLAPSIVNNHRLVVMGGTDDIDVEWGKESTWIGKKYPESPNCKTARFKAKRLLASKDLGYKLCILDDEGIATVLINITVDEID